MTVKFGGGDARDAASKRGQVSTTSSMHHFAAIDPRFAAHNLTR
jgi:hypothetical protein